MNIQYLINNKSTLISLNQKLKNFKKEYENNSSVLETSLNTFIFVFWLIINIIASFFCAKFLVEENILGMLIISFTLLFDFLFISSISSIRDKLVIGKKYNKFQQAFNEFEGESISFSKKELIESTINNLTKKEKNLLEEFIEKSDKKYKIKMQNNISKILIENKELFHKYDRDNLIEVINLIDNNNLKSELINKVISIDLKKNKVIKNKTILEI